VRGEQVVERLDELDFSHPSLDGDEAARKEAVNTALIDAAKAKAGRTQGKPRTQQRVLGTDTVVRVSTGVYSLRSKQPGDAAAATTAPPPPPPPTAAAQPVRSPFPPFAAWYRYLRLLTEHSKPAVHATLSPPG
jgi:hypothetical protein